jgi:DNA polymerase V
MLPAIDSGFTGRPAQRTARGLLSLTHPNREFFYRQRALLRSAVPAGFPSPADDYVEQRLSLDAHLIQHRESTFFMRVSAVLDGEFTVKQLLHTPDGRVLRAAHPDYPDMLIKPEQDFSVWGVVSWNIHKV